MTPQPPRSSRRAFLLKTAGVLGATLTGLYAMRTRIADAWLTRTVNTVVPGQGISFLDSDACVLTPQNPEGPYYIDEDYMGDVLIRRDVRDGLPGVDLRLTFKVVDAATCAPLPGVAVDIWSCDAAGRYSGHAGADPNQIPFLTALKGHVDPTTPDRALRGRQLTDAQGIAEFLTLFPGWYKPRTVHLHLLVKDAGQRLAVTQIYFPQEITDLVHAQSPYRERGPSLYTNANDSLIHQEGAGAGWPKLAAEGNGYHGTLTIGVQSNEA